MRDLGVNDQQLYECKSLRLTYFFGKSICFLATLLNSPLLVRATSILVWLNPQRMSCSTPFLFSQMLQAKSLMLVVGPVNTLNLVYSCWSWLNTWLNLVEPCWTMLDLVTPACFFHVFPQLKLVPSIHQRQEKKLGALSVRRGQWGRGCSRGDFVGENWPWNEKRWGSPWNPNEIRMKIWKLCNLAISWKIWLNWRKIWGFYDIMAIELLLDGFDHDRILRSQMFTGKMIINQWILG